MSKLTKITSLQKKSQNKITQPSLALGPRPDGHFKRIWSLVRWFLVFRRQYLILKWAKKIYSFRIYLSSLFRQQKINEQHLQGCNSAPLSSKNCPGQYISRISTITWCKNARKKNIPSISVVIFELNNCNHLVLTSIRNEFIINSEFNFQIRFSCMKESLKGIMCIMSAPIGLSPNKSEL